MVALAPIVVNDRETTPVAHTFNPSGENAATGLRSFSESNGGVPVGARRFTTSLRKQKDGGYRVRLNLTSPVLATETVNGISSPKVIRTNYGSVEFTMAGTSTTQERKNLVGMIANALAASGQAMLNGLLVDGEDIY